MILWLDLETTGVDEDDEILEVGMVLSRADDTLSVVSEYQRIYKTRVPVSKIDPTVFRMHVQNGLFDDMYEYAERYAHEDEDSILQWLGENDAIGKGVNRLALAGSGVAHFDRRFLTRAWPKLDRRLEYWTYDVGCMRRLARLGGAAFGPEIERRKHPEADIRAHRAIPDVYDAMDEARAFIRAMQQMTQLKEAA